MSRDLRVPMRCRPALLGLGLCLAVALPVHATDAARCDGIAKERTRNDCRAVSAMPPLRLPSAPEPHGVQDTAQMAIVKPPGDGPFRAALLLHTCGGMGAHLVYWARQVLAAGYIAFILDSDGPRRIGNSCDGLRSVPVVAMRIRDAYEALEHLAQFPFVDGKRIAAMGFSHGARIAYELASPSAAEVYSPSGRRFAALVAFFGRCFEPQTNGLFLRPDTDVPLLALFGAWDQDGDAGDCVPHLQEVKARGAVVQWHIFPGVGHAWDRSQFRTQSFVTYFGRKTIAVYKPEVTEASRKLAFDFLAERFRQS